MLEKEYLIFQLQGVLASWGDIAIGETRSSCSHPTKTAILGLLAAALGIQRTEEDELLELSAKYNFAVRVDKKGILVCDYHTTQTPTASSLKKNPHKTRLDELNTGDLNTILSTREYYCDVFYTAVLWEQSDGLPYSLEKLKQALQIPCFPLYLGRKSCPLSLPLNPQIYTAKNIKEALVKADDSRQTQQNLQKLSNGSFKFDDSKMICFDAGIGDDSGFDILQTVRRKDKLLSRKRWQFADRFEKQVILKEQQEVV